MRKFAVYSLILIVFIAMTNCGNKNKIKYPVTKKVDTVDTYFGIQVPDPYRWLEDDNSEETKAWVKAQNAVTESYLAQIPYRQGIKDRLKEIYNYPKFGAPFKEGGKIYFYKNDGLQKQAVLYKADSLEAEPKVFLDPNTFSEDGTIALAGTSFSRDGKLMTYSISSGGSDWNEIFVVETETGKKLDDHIMWTKFSGAVWKGDGFYYTRYAEPKKGDQLKGQNVAGMVYYHKVGTKQSQDVLVFEDPKNPLRGNYAGVTEDETILVISQSNPGQQGNSLRYKRLDDPKADFVFVDEGFDYEYGIIDRIGDLLYIQTNNGAPKNKIVALDLKNPAKENWKTIIPEKEHVLSGAGIYGGKLMVQYMQDACDHGYVYDIEGKLIHEVQLPGIGTIGGFNGKKDESIGFYTFTSFTYPTTIFKYDIEKNVSEVYRKPEVKFNPEEYESKQVFFTSKDGTKVPMFIVHKKGIELNGKNPTLLYGYGGFNISMTPSFSVMNLVFLENGGVYVVVNLRGGGEYGEEWHLAGTKLKKQNVFDDFIGAAEYLIKEKYTSSEKLAIRGGSNGGLLVGACMTQRPDLFKVALPAVGVMDMLRYHKFTIGYAWASDYGTSDDSKEMFEYLKGYSPLHNLKKGTKYPATLVTTADHDDRVVPAHSFKFAAALQECQKGNNPAIIRIETKAGHGAGKPTDMIIDEYGDMWSFVFYNLGMKFQAEVKK